MVEYSWKFTELTNEQKEGIVYSEKFIDFIFQNGT